MRSGMSEFDVEWEAAQGQIIARSTAILSDLGMSAEGVAYVRGMKGYPRIPYLAVIYVLDPALRMELGIWVCIHAIGIKLIDDLIDRDQPISHWDQALGIYLVQKTTAELCKYDSPSAVVNSFAEDYHVIWQQQIHEMRSPPGTLRQWVEYARIKSGLMMSNYAAVACTAGGSPGAVEPARAFAEAVGVLFMIGDDFRDYDEMNETKGNLKHLVELGRVQTGDLSEEIRCWQQRAIDALRQGPAAFDLAFFISDYSDRIIAQIPVATRR